MSKEIVDGNDADKTFMLRMEELWRENQFCDVTIVVGGEKVLNLNLSCGRCWAWWRHQMEIFSALLAICAGNSPVVGEFPAERPVTRSFHKQLSKQSLS